MKHTEEKEVYTGKSFNRLYKYFLKNIKIYIIALILTLFIVGVDLLHPLLLGKVIDILYGVNEIIRGGDYTRADLLAEYKWIIFMILGFMFLSYIGSILSYYQAVILQRTGQSALHDIRRDVFKHIETLSTDQINKLPIGKLVTRVTSDTSTLNQLYTNVIINLIRNILTIVGVLVVMIVLSIKLSLYVLAFTPIIIGTTLLFRYFSKIAYRNTRNKIADMNAFLSENISGIKITQIFNQEQKKINEFSIKNKALKKAQFKEIINFSIFRPLIFVFYILTTILVIYLGYKEALAGLITGGIVVSFYTYVNKFYDPLQQLAEQYNTILLGVAAAEKIVGIFEIEPMIKDSVNAIALKEVRGEIEFKNVSFSYVKDEEVLKNVSFKIKAGETVAFVGATGSGKSTILSLMVRNYDIEEGEILLDGVNIKDIKLTNLRSIFGQMLQDIFLFSGTIKSNITLDNEFYTDEDIDEVSKKVNLTNFVETLPNRFNEEVRERGNNFSSGQKQLISFARTLIAKPKVIILDEATANIDTETEVLIQDSIEKMMGIGTVLIVAHRLSTIQHANKIIVLHKGIIEEEGTHQQLLAKKGRYYRLYRLQYEKEITQE